jgi:hypothetical protein
MVCFFKTRRIGAGSSQSPSVINTSNQSRCDQTFGEIFQINHLVIKPPVNHLPLSSLLLPFLTLSYPLFPFK